MLGRETMRIKLKRSRGGSRRIKTDWKGLRRTTWHACSRRKQSITIKIKMP